MCNGTLTRVSDSNRVHVVYDDDVYKVLYICVQFVQFLTVSTCNYVHLISQDRANLYKKKRNGRTFVNYGRMYVQEL